MLVYWSLFNRALQGLNKILHAPLRIYEVVVIRRQSCLVDWVLLEFLEVFQFLEDYLTEHIKIGQVCQRRVVKLVDRGSYLRSIVSLSGPDVRISINQRVFLFSLLLACTLTYLGPSYDAVLHHQVPCKRC